MKITSRDLHLCWETVPSIPYSPYLISPSNNNILIMLIREIRVVHLSLLNTINTPLTKVNSCFFSHMSTILVYALSL